MARTSQRDLVNRVTEGKLYTCLREAAEGTRPYGKLAAELYAEYGVLISIDSLRRWAREVVTEDGAPVDALSHGCRR